MSTQGPSLADDEASLAAYAQALGDAFDQVVRTWFVRLVETRSPGATTDDAVLEQLSTAAQETSQELRALLARDISAQQVGPLELLRRSVTGSPTEVLKRLGVEPVERDDFARSNFPDDLYDMAPASFRDIDPALHEPGLVWGAAKAHVHLRRRREAAGA